MKPKFYYSELDNYNEKHLKRIILYLKEVIECTDPLLKKLEEDSVVDTALKCYKKELEDKINKILNEFANATDIDGRETLYKYTDCDLADLRAEILELLK